MPRPKVYLLLLVICLQAGVQSTPLLISPYRNWRVPQNIVREQYTRTKSDKRSLADSFFEDDLGYREAPPSSLIHSLMRHHSHSTLEDLENSEQTHGYEVLKRPISLWPVKRYYVLKRADDSKKALFWPESIESMERK